MNSKSRVPKTHKTIKKQTTQKRNAKRAVTTSAHPSKTTSTTSQRASVTPHTTSRADEQKKSTEDKTLSKHPQTSHENELLEPETMRMPSFLNQVAHNLNVMDRVFEARNRQFESIFNSFFPTMPRMHTIRHRNMKMDHEHDYDDTSYLSPAVRNEVDRLRRKDERNDSYGLLDRFLRGDNMLADWLNTSERIQHELSHDMQRMGQMSRMLEGDEKPFKTRKSSSKMYQTSYITQPNGETKFHVITGEADDEKPMTYHLKRGMIDHKNNTKIVDSFDSEDYNAIKERLNQKFDMIEDKSSDTKQLDSKRTGENVTKIDENTYIKDDDKKFSSKNPVEPKTTSSMKSQDDTRSKSGGKSSYSTKM